MLRVELCPKEIQAQPQTRSEDEEKLLHFFSRPRMFDDEEHLTLDLRGRRLWLEYGDMNPVHPYDDSESIYELRSWDCEDDFPLAYLLVRGSDSDGTILLDSMDTN